EDAGGILVEVHDRIPSVKSAITEGQAAIAAASDFLQQVEDDIAAVGPIIAEEAENIANMFAEVDEWRDTAIGELDGDLPPLSVDGDMTEMIDQLEGTIADLQQVQEQLDEPNETVTALIESLEE